MSDLVLYYQHDDGSVSQRTLSSSGEEEPAHPEPPDGATEITAEEYAQALAEIDAERQQALAAQAAAEEQQRADDYNALIAAGVPAATASRLTGYTPPAEEQS
jgi:hypothetical protein